MEFIKSCWYWAALPVRFFLYGCAFIFGHPLVFLPLTAVGTAAAFWDHRLQLAGLGCAVVGLLLMWISENPGSTNSAWPARSPFAPPLSIET